MKTSLKNRLRIILNCFAIIPIRPVTYKTGFWLELERGERAQVQTEMVEFIALPLPFPSKLTITYNLVISRRSCAVKAKKCTK